MRRTAVLAVLLAVTAGVGQPVGQPVGATTAAGSGTTAARLTGGHGDGYYHDFDRREARRKHDQWSLRASKVGAAWRISRGAGVTVAVVDSGVGPTWELEGQLAARTNLAGRPSPRIDEVDHGTAVASLIAARAGRHGITGVAPAAKILSVRVFGSYDAPARRVVEGIRWAVDHDADVINLSLVDEDSAMLRSAIRYAVRHRVVVVAGAGNDGPDGGVQYPAAYPGVIAVGAVDSDLEVADFSSEGSYVDVVAAGDRVLASDPFGTLSWYSGTSFSTPTVSGVVALMKAANPRIRPGRVASILRATARDLGPSGHDRSYGSGLVDADRAVRAARALR